METAFNLSLLFTIASTITKAITHVILDFRNGYKVEFARSNGYVYFLPYKKSIQEKDEKFRRVCNISQKFMIISLIIFLIIFVIKTLRRF